MLKLFKSSNTSSECTFKVIWFFIFPPLDTSNLCVLANEEQCDCHNYHVKVNVQLLHHIYQKLYLQQTRSIYLILVKGIPKSYRLDQY
jgi:hypothetical protein